MKTCSKCGLQFADEWLACPACGSKPETGGSSRVSYTEGYTSSKVTRGDSTQHVGGNGGQKSAGGTADGGYSYGSSNTEGSYNYGGSKQYNSNNLEMPFYYRGWFIVLSFLIFWPAGIVLLVLRNTKGVNYSDFSKSGSGSWPRKIIGGALTFIGVCCLSSVFDSYSFGDVMSTLTIAAAFTIGGVLLLLSGLNKGKSARGDWALYESLIDNQGNTKISFIASRLGKKEQKVATKLQKMLNRGFLQDPENGIGAYINGEYNLLVMTKNGVPMVPIEETMAADIELKKKKEAEEAAREERIKRENAKSIEEKAIYAIEDAISKTDDEETEEYLINMKTSVKKIVKLVEQEPEYGERKSVRDLRNSYLPTTLELLEKMHSSTTSEDAKQQLKGMFYTLAQAFGNIEKQLVKKEDTGIELDIDVLRQTLAREGLLDSDFKVKAN